MPAKERNELNQKWKNFIEIAKNKNPNFEEPTLPFSENYCISNYSFDTVFIIFSGHLINYIYDEVNNYECFSNYELF